MSYTVGAQEMREKCGRGECILEGVMGAGVGDAIAGTDVGETVRELPIRIQGAGHSKCAELGIQRQCNTESGCATAQEFGVESCIVGSEGAALDPFGELGQHLSGWRRLT